MTDQELFSLSKRLVAVAGDMKRNGETMGEKRAVDLSHWELGRLIDALQLVEAVRLVQRPERK